MILVSSHHIRYSITLTYVIWYTLMHSRYNRQFSSLSYSRIAAAAFLHIIIYTTAVHPYERNKVPGTRSAMDLLLWYART